MIFRQLRARRHFGSAPDDDSAPTGFARNLAGKRHEVLERPAAGFGGTPGSKNPVVAVRRFKWFRARPGILCRELGEHPWHSGIEIVFGRNAPEFARSKLRRPRAFGKKLRVSVRAMQLRSLRPVGTLIQQPTTAIR